MIYKGIRSEHDSLNAEAAAKGLGCKVKWHEYNGSYRTGRPPEILSYPSCECKSEPHNIKDGPQDGILNSPAEAILDKWEQLGCQINFAFSGRTWTLRLGGVVLSSTSETIWGAINLGAIAQYDMEHRQCPTTA